MRALNLLHYPSLARQQKVFHRWWSSLAGLLLGGAVAWGWLQWQDIQTLRLRQTQSLLQASLTTRNQQAKEAVQGQTQLRLQAAQEGEQRKLLAEIINLKNMDRKSVLGRREIDELMDLCTSNSYLPFPINHISSRTLHHAA